MGKEYYEVGKAPQLIFKSASGDLVVRSWAENRVLLKGEYTAEETEAGLIISASGSLSARVPEGSSVDVQAASGDLIIKGLQGDVRVQTAHGDLIVKNAAQADIEDVHGDLVVVNVAGAVNVGQAYGDISVRRVGNLHVRMASGDIAGRYLDGQVEIEQVMGDVSLNTVTDDLRVGTGHRDVNLRNLGGLTVVDLAHGDIRLRGGLSAGKHRLNAQGDVVLRWPLTAPLNLDVKAARILNRLTLEDVDSTEETLTGRIGEGETTLSIEAGGRVVLKELEPEGEWETYGGEFGAEFGADFANIGVELAGLSERIASEVNSRLSEVAGRLERQLGPEFAQKMAEKAARQAERAVERAARQAERSRRRAESMDAWQPSHRPPKKTGPSADEQKKVLEMLEKGIISVEEANALLKAMES